MSLNHEQQPEPADEEILPLNHPIPDKEEDIRNLRLVRHHLAIGTYHQNGDDEDIRLARAEADHAYQQLVAGKQRLIRKIVMRTLLRHGIDTVGQTKLIAVLQNAGNEAVVEAVIRFDLNRDTAFSTYVTHWISMLITKALHEEIDIISKPKLVRDRQRIIIQTTSHLQQTGNLSPTVQDIAQFIYSQHLFDYNKIHLDLDAVERIVKQIAFSIHSNDLESLDAPLSNEANPEDDEYEYRTDPQTSQMETALMITDEYQQIADIVSSFSAAERTIFDHVITMLQSGMSEITFANSIGVRKETFNVRKLQLFDKIRRELARRNRHNPTATKKN